AKRFLATVIEGLESLENAPASEEMVIFYLSCVRAHYFNQRFEELKPFIQKIEEMAEHLGTTSARTVALYAKSYQLLATNANQEDIIKLYKTVIEVNKTAKDSMFYMHLANLNLAILLRNNNPKKAIKYFDEAIKIAQHVGSMLQEGNAQGGLIRTLAFTGNLIQAKIELDKVEDVSKIADHDFYPIMSRSILFHYQGYHQKAENILYPIWLKMITTNNAQTINIVGLHLGEILFELNKTTEARNIIDLLIKEYYSIVQIDHKLRPLTLSALIELSLGETKKAKETLEKTIRNYDKDLRWSRYEMLYYLRAKGMLLAAENQWDDAWKTFSEAIEMASSAGFNWRRTRLRLQWAEAHFSRGGKEFIEHGIKMMGHSQSEFKEMGADGWVRMIDGRMNELGIIPGSDKPAGKNLS
ncbi:MAG TPA: tetratricopeptide repeat protein, partial [Anaerolineales bacterium]|nr:tetratricopeptide repeat protein [Anaerolineales bacterium]